MNRFHITYSLIIAIGFLTLGECSVQGELSAVGKRVLSQQRFESGLLEHASVTIYAHSKSIVEAVSRQARHALRRLDYYIGENSSLRPARVFMIEDVALWERTIQSWGRHDSVALTIQDDIFVLDDKNTTNYWNRLAHEMVHLRLRHLYEDRLPLWLDEGMAGFVGWEITKDYCKLLGKHIVRHVPEMGSVEVIPIEQLVAMNTYPKNAVLAQAFYRETEALVRGIATRIGDFRLTTFVKTQQTGERLWREVLMADFKLTDRECAELERTTLDSVHRGGAL